MDICPNMVGSNLRHLREVAGLTQMEVASHLHISYQQVQKYETGANRLPIDKLFQLKHLYDIPYDAFFNGANSNVKCGQAKFGLDSQIVSSVVKLHKLQDHVLKKKIEDVLSVLLA